jgi:hypothetical protein
VNLAQEESERIFMRHGFCGEILRKPTHDTSGQRLTRAHGLKDAVKHNGRLGGNCVILFLLANRFAIVLPKIWTMKHLEMAHHLRSACPRRDPGEPKKLPMPEAPGSAAAFFL